MPRTATQKSDVFFRAAKWSGNPNGDKLTDSGGLFLHVQQAGKYWRMAYRIHGKQKTLAVGVYPAVSLAQARKARDDAKALLAQGLDPSTTKQDRRHAEKIAAANTYEIVAREFHKIKADGWSEGHAAKWLRMSEMYLFPEIGRMPIDTIEPMHLLSALRKVEAKGILSTVGDLQQMAGQVFRYAVQTGRIKQSPARDLKGALQPHVPKNFAAMTDPVQVGGMLRAIDGYWGTPITCAALKIAALLFQRPGNIRAMRWAWVDLEGGMLTVPSADMKRTRAAKLNGAPHYTPLAKQAVSILRELHPLTGRSEYVFMGARSSKRPMSENTLNAALRRMDISQDDHVTHGYRAMARTMFAERIKGFEPDMLEAQLAHGKSGPLGSAYDRAQYMEQRRHMMQVWADYLDELRQGAQVVKLRA